MKLFDLHCDTATRLLSENKALYDNDLHISLKNAEYITQYAQVMAVWTDRRLNDADGYARFFEVIKNLEREAEVNSRKTAIAKSFKDITNIQAQGMIPLIISVEDARILENDISRLDSLYAAGVRLLTLNWYGKTCIGGAHDTHIGLSDFGARVVQKCFDIGIIPDISHCSFEGAEMTLESAKINGKPIVASHSDSYSLNPHTRNLKDRYFLDIVALGGLVGINLCPAHLSDRKSADISDIMKHIEYYLSLGGENCIAMGGDLDGTDLPVGFSGIADIYKIADEMQRLNYSAELTEKILYRNAFDFFKRNL